MPLPIVEDAVEKRPLVRFKSEENVLLPENVLLFASKVELAAVIVPELPSEMPVPFTVIDEL